MGECQDQLEQPLTLEVHDARSSSEVCGCWLWVAPAVLWVLSWPLMKLQTLSVGEIQDCYQLHRHLEWMAGFDLFAEGFVHPSQALGQGP